MKKIADVVFIDGTVDQIEIKTIGREKLINAHVRIGTELNKIKPIAGISAIIGYVWTGHNGDGNLFRNMTNRKWSLI